MWGVGSNVIETFSGKTSLFCCDFMLLQSDPVTQHSRHPHPTDSDDFDAGLFLSKGKLNIGANEQGASESI